MQNTELMQSSLSSYTEFVCRSCSVCLAQWSIIMARCPMKHMVRIRAADGRFMECSPALCCITWGQGSIEEKIRLQSVPVSLTWSVFLSNLAE